ncbi:MAG: hypothetical protein Q8K58_03965 [Acidimicrobiales bacterium]|nr:hypothetical protein [Acidimicrobiales bacterium]
MIDETELRELASQQHGVVAVHQAEALGYTRRTRDVLVDGHRWARAAPRVLRLPGAPITDAQAALIAVLDAGPGAALRGESAAAWWAIPGNLLLPAQVVRPRSRRDLWDRVGVAHQPLLLPADHVVVLQGIPTVVPCRALFDVAGTQRRGAEIPWWVERMARMVDTAWAMRLVSGRSLHAMFGALARRGRPGIGVMRQVLEDRGLDYVTPASGLESRVAQILRRAGQPPLRRQVDSGDGDGWIGRVDFRDASLPVVVEVQSERFHTSRIDAQLDAHRRSLLATAGFEVVEILEFEVWHRPQEVIRKVAEGRRRVAARMRAAA